MLKAKLEMIEANILSYKIPTQKEYRSMKNQWLELIDQVVIDLKSDLKNYNSELLIVETGFTARIKCTPISNGLMLLPAELNFYMVKPQGSLKNHETNIRVKIDTPAEDVSDFKLTGISSILDSMDTLCRINTIHTLKG